MGDVVGFVEDEVEVGRVARRFGIAAVGDLVALAASVPGGSGTPALCSRSPACSGRSWEASSPTPVALGVGHQRPHRDRRDRAPSSPAATTTPPLCNVPLVFFYYVGAALIVLSGVGSWCCSATGAGTRRRGTRGRSSGSGIAFDRLAGRVPVVGAAGAQAVAAAAPVPRVDRAGELRSTTSSSGRSSPCGSSSCFFWCSSCAYSRRPTWACSSSRLMFGVVGGTILSGWLIDRSGLLQDLSGARRRLRHRRLRAAVVARLVGDLGDGRRFRRLGWV